MTTMECFAEDGAAAKRCRLGSALISALTVSRADRFKELTRVGESGSGGTTGIKAAKGAASFIKIKA